jgi:hypothetical protein
MIFTHAAPAAISASTAATSSSAATGERMRGKYRLAGAGNRPAAVTTGRPAAVERANPRVAWLRPPTSRITVTPLAAYSCSVVAPYSRSARNGRRSSLSTGLSHHVGAYSHSSSCSQESFSSRGSITSIASRSRPR